MALWQVAIPILSFHEGSASNAWDHDSILARTQARLTTYCAGLCFKSLASKFFFFTRNKFLLSTQKTRRLSQLLKQKSIIIICPSLSYDEALNETGFPTIISY